MELAQRRGTSATPQRALHTQTPPESVRAKAQPGDEHKDAKQPNDKQPPLLDKPGAGRTTKLGRKTESPASIKTAGPSGQRGRTQHQKLHANK